MAPWSNELSEAELSAVAYYVRGFFQGDTCAMNMTEPMTGLSGMDVIVGLAVLFTVAFLARMDCLAALAGLGGAAQVPLPGRRAKL